MELWGDCDVFVNFYDIKLRGSKGIYEYTTIMIKMLSSIFKMSLLIPIKFSNNTLHLSGISLNLERLVFRAYLL